MGALLGVLILIFCLYSVIGLGGLGFCLLIYIALVLIGSSLPDN